MKINTALLFFAALGLIATTSASGIPGYILSFDKQSPNKLLKETPNHVTYNDQDIQSLVLHNLGLLQTANDLSEASKDLVSQYGSRNILSQQKLNYVFLLERNTPDAIFETEKKIFAKSVVNHQNVLLDVCNVGSESGCLLNHLFDGENDESVINKIEEHTGTKSSEVYFYNTNSRLLNSNKATLAQISDKNGNLFIQDQNSKNSFKIASNLESCVNNALKGVFVADLQKGTISSAKVTDGSDPVLITVPKDARSAFNLFMNDICSVWGVSTLVRRDSHPSLFVFHLESLGNLESFLSKDQQSVVHSVFANTYEKFVKNILAHYDQSELSGQVMMLNHKNTAKDVTVENESLIQFNEKLSKARMLQSTDSGSTAILYYTNPTTNIIFKSILVAFVLIMAWVCIEMFNIDVQKDSVVYAKFLAADYFRR